MLLSGGAGESLRGAEQSLHLARQLRRENNPLEASRVLISALRAAPTSAALYGELGMTLFHLGLMERALHALEEAVRLEPNALQYQLNLSGIYHHTGRHRDCIKVASRLLEDDCAHGLAHMNLGLSYSALGKWDISIGHFQLATEYLPKHCGAWLNLGLGYENRCADEQANRCFKEAVKLEPENLQAWICLATNNLRRGAFQEGWKQFSKRFEIDPSLAPRGDTPIWRGEPLNGCTIHLMAEQGLGDLVQFIRFAKPLHDRGAEVLVSAPAMLCELLATVPGVSKCYSHVDDVPACDYQATVMELPRWLEIDEENIPLSGGYLDVSEARDSFHNQIQELGDKVKVGIVWAGNPNHVNDSRRSMSFQDLEPLLDLPNIQLVNLQLGEQAKQLEEHPRSNEVMNWMPSCMNASQTASLLKELDLVITVDTFVAHLAGALNVTTWLCVAANPDWRWLTKREDSPWYQSVRIFRQDHSACWSSVMKDLVHALARVFPE